MSTLAISVSGIRSASTRVAAASHNVANFLTSDFRPLDVVQREAPHGGSEAHVRPSETPRPVDLGKEFVNQALAAVQFRASLGVIKAEKEMQQSLLDLFA